MADRAPDGSDGEPDMNTNTDTARDAVADVLAAVLIALVALDGLDEIEPPADALDLALASHEPYRAARDRFHGLHESLRDRVEQTTFFRLEEAVSQMVVAAVDVGFRVGHTTSLRK